MDFKILDEVSLKNYNTFGIDVRAKYFAEIVQEEDLLPLFESAVFKTEKLLVLGGGSNILFTGYFDGLVIKNSLDGIEVKESGSHTSVTAGGGVVWNTLVQYCVVKAIRGLENLSLIPGTVGASPVQNIGAYGVELEDCFASCRAFDLQQGTFRTFVKSECGFAYRDSIFKNVYKNRFLITQVTFDLDQSKELNVTYGAIQEELLRREILVPTIRDVADVVSAIRVSKLPDPSTIGNAGSFFKNPIIGKPFFAAIQKQFPAIVHYPMADGNVKVAAGWLIEQCGFKGVHSGNTGTWKNQALVIVNHGGATGSEVYDFSEQIIIAVAQKFQIDLEREVNIF